MALTISANGLMLPAFVIFQKLRKKPNVNLPSNIVLNVSQSGFMDSTLMIDYVDKILKPVSSKNKILLIMDELSAHTTDSVVNSLRNCNIEHIVIPAKFTSELQPLDVSINAPFKTNFREIWSEYMLNSVPQYTPSGNRKKPSYDCQLQMISAAIEKTNHIHTISYSFIACGLSCRNDTDNQFPEKSVLYYFNERLKKIFPLGTNWNDYFKSLKKDIVGNLNEIQSIQQHLHIAQQCIQHAQNQIESAQDHLSNIQQEFNIHFLSPEPSLSNTYTFDNGSTFLNF